MGCDRPRFSVVTRVAPLAVTVALALDLSSSPVRALEVLANEHVSLEAGGDVKTFLVAVFPYEHALLPQDPQGRALLDVRLKLDAAVGDWLRVVVHPNLVTAYGAPAGGVGAGASARLTPQPEAITLSRTLVSSSGLGMNVRVDRAALTLRFPNLDFTVGRQAMSFGTTFFFTPLDVVAPFHPLVVDREYKPGVDALRADVYSGTSNKLTLVAAYAGSWDLDGLVLAAHVGSTVFGVDVGVFAAEVHRQAVLGADTAGELLGFGVRAEGTVTLPADLRRPYLRAALGVDRRFENGLMLSGELYVQTLGGERPSDYYDVARRPEFARGEIWALGRYYGALSASFELLPVLTVGCSSVANLGDQSMLLGPSLTWSLSDDAVLAAGAYATLGERPASTPTGDPTRPLKLGSEFGTSPASAFLQFKAYF
ncbi:MAG: hypothetical protein AB2A00_23470 [Myxococcota bacterium]